MNDESDCIVPGCTWIYQPPPVDREKIRQMLRSGQGIAGVVKAMIGSEEDLAKALLAHIVSHGRDGALAFLAAGKRLGVLDDPDLFLKAQAETAELVRKYNITNMEEIERWFQEHIAADLPGE